MRTLYQKGLYPELAARSQELLTSLSETDVSNLSHGPKCFYTLVNVYLFMFGECIIKPTMKREQKRDKKTLTKVVENACILRSNLKVNMLYHGLEQINCLPDNFCIIQHIESVCIFKLICNYVNANLK